MTKPSTNHHSEKSTRAVTHSSPKPSIKVAASSIVSAKPAPRAAPAPLSGAIRTHGHGQHVPSSSAPKASASTVSAKPAPRAAPAPLPGAIRARGHGQQVPSSNAPKASAPPLKLESQQKAGPAIAASALKTPWTVEAASRIYKGTARDNGGQVKKGTFPAAAMSQAMKTAPPGKARSK